MEEWQKKHITENLPTLIENTLCSGALLSKLRAVGILSVADLAILEKKSLDSYEQTKKLYEIVQTRSNGFENLKLALQETQQTGAHKILDQLSSKTLLAATSFRNYGSISYDRSMLLGKGCYNTKVFKGKVANREVAVKEINCDEVDVNQALEEVSLLVKLDWHENIVRYFNAEVTEDFILIALELCTMNLDSWVRSKQISIQPVEILQQSTAGIMHLHRNHIIHRDLKPANILIAKLPNGECRAKISDFGLSRKIHEERSSFTFQSANFGTEGWIAPEVVKVLETTPITSAIVKMSFASDVFSLGCIFYFILTDGIHPFGNPIRRETNILDDKYSLKMSELKCQENGILFLIRSMINPIPKMRPPSSAICSHHFFWSTNKILQFLSAISFLLNKNMDDVTKCIAKLNQGQYSEWPEKLCLKVKKYLREKNLCGPNMRGLLEAFGYLEIYYEGLPESVKAALGTMPDNFLHYWLSRFQSLLPSLWQGFQPLKHIRILKIFYNDQYDFGNNDEESGVLEDALHAGEQIEAILDKNQVVPSTLLKAKSVYNILAALSEEDALEDHFVQNRVKLWETELKPDKFVRKTKLSFSSSSSLSVRNYVKKINTMIASLAVNSGNISIPEIRKHEIMQHVDPTVFASSVIVGRLSISKVKEENELMRIVKIGSLSDIEECCTNYNDAALQQHVKHIRRQLPQIHRGSLLHVAVMRGNLQIVEYLLKNQDFETMLTQKNKSQQFKNLLHVCLIETQRLRPEDIEEKIKIVFLLCKINRTLVTEAQINASNAHVELLITLINLAFEQENEDHGFSVDLHTAIKYMNADSFHKLVVALSKFQWGQMLSWSREYKSNAIVAALDRFEPKPGTINMFSGGRDLKILRQDKFQGRTLLYRAIEIRSSATFIETLKQHKAILNDQESSMIHICIETENIPQLIRELRDKQTNINATDKYGRTALHSLFIKTSSNLLQKCEILVEAGIDVNIQDIEGKTALWMTLKHSNWKDLFGYLIRNRANPNVPDKNGDTILHMAIRLHRTQRDIQYLVEHGANAKATGIEGQTLLHTAVQVRYAGIIEYLVSVGINVNYRDIDGYAALHFLFKMDSEGQRGGGSFANEQCYQVLKKFEKIRDVNWIIKTGKGTTILELANRIRYALSSDVMQLIKSKTK